MQIFVARNASVHYLGDMKNTDNITALAAALAECEADINHCEWFITNAPGGIDRSWAYAKRDLLKGQTLGNILVDLRAAIAAYETGR